MPKSDAAAATLTFVCTVQVFQNCLSILLKSFFKISDGNRHTAYFGYKDVPYICMSKEVHYKQYCCTA